MAVGLKELVLGGNGLIGSALCGVLHGSGSEVVSLDLAKGYDLRDGRTEDFQGFDRVWFLAWDTGGAKYLNDEAFQHSMYKHNTELCTRVFDILDRTKLPFLFVTSQLAGEHTAYGMTKLMAEHWARQLSGKVAKLWNVYGWETPGQRSHVVPDLVLGGVANGMVRCATSGAEKRQWLHKTDCASALTHLFDSNQEYADITSGEWVSVRDVAATIAGQLDVPLEVGSLPGRESLNGPSVPLVGWRAAMSLSEGIENVIADATAWRRGNASAMAGS